MKKFAGCLFACLTAAVLSACSGGGSSGGSPHYVPAPQPTPIANTTLSYYMPLAQGNSWTFASGGKMEDLGSAALSCSCVANGIQSERVALYSPGSAVVSGSFFFTKTPASGQFGELTNVIGVENDANTNNVSIMADSTYPDGFPVMDDKPSVNEFWSDGGETSTVTSVGGTLLLPNGDEVIDIAVDNLTGASNPVTWAFARGVGITQIGVNGQSTTITDFTVNTSTSQSAVRQTRFTATRLLGAQTGRSQAATLLKKLFR